MLEGTETLNVEKTSLKEVLLHRNALVRNSGTQVPFCLSLFVFSRHPVSRAPLLWPHYTYGPTTDPKQLGKIEWTETTSIYKMFISDTLSQYRKLIHSSVQTSTGNPTDVHTTYTNDHVCEHAYMLKCTCLGAPAYTHTQFRIQDDWAFKVCNK